MSSVRKTDRRISAGARWRPLGAIPLGAIHPGTSPVEDPIRAIPLECHQRGHRSDYHHRLSTTTVRPTPGRLTNGLLLQHPTHSATAADLLIHQHTEGRHVRHTTRHAAETLRTLICLHFRQYQSEVQQGSSTYDIATYRRNHYDTVEYDLSSFARHLTFCFM